MQLQPDQLAVHLAKPLAPLYLLHGDEPLLVAEAGDAIRAAARRQGFEEREVLVVGPGFRWDELHLAAGNLSLFGGAKLIDLRIPNGKPGKDGGDALLRHAREPLSGVVTLITLPELDWSLRKAAWFSGLAEAGVVIEANAPPRERLPAWLAERLTRQGQSAPADALSFIADHVEGNLLAAHQELQKLALLYPQGALTLAQVQQSVLDVTRYDLDDLRTALLSGDAARCTRLLDGLRGEGVAPPLVLWALGTEIRSLALIAQGLADGQPLAALLKAERVFDPQRRQLVQQVLQRCRAPQLRAALQHAARIDRLIKGVASGDVWNECLRLCLRLCRR